MELSEYNSTAPNSAVDSVSAASKDDADYADERQVAVGYYSTSVSNSIASIKRSTINHDSLVPAATAANYPINRHMTVSTNQDQLQKAHVSADLTDEDKGNYYRHLSSVVCHPVVSNGFIQLSF